MMQKLLVGLSCLLFAYACTAEGAWDLLRDIDQPVTVTFQDGANGYFGTKDAHLVEWAAAIDNNTGGHDRIEATKRTANFDDDKAIVLEFDVSSIPSSATVISADLSLFLIDQRSGSNPKILNVHKITETWIEGFGLGIDGEDIPGVDWLSMPLFDAPSINDQLIGTAEDTWYTFHIGSAVQSWVSSPSSNYGVILIEDTPIMIVGTKVFASSEHANPTYRPKLTVSYIY